MDRYGKYGKLSLKKLISKSDTAIALLRLYPKEMKRISTFYVY